jgi:endonuclease-3
MDDKVKKRALAINRRLKRLFPGERATHLRFRTPWECMVAVQLSAQCTDTKVNEVTAKVFKKYRTLDDYVRAKPREFQRDIFQTGFYRNKTKNILAAARMVKNEFGGKLPKTMREMLRIPGVARKTANVVLGNVYGIVEGIAVDTHVRRLSRQWGLTKHSDPKKIEQDLMVLLPKRDWFGWTYRVISYGRTYSPARRKNHNTEPLAKYYTNNEREGRSEQRAGRAL